MYTHDFNNENGICSQQFCSNVNMFGFIEKYNVEQDDYRFPVLAKRDACDPRTIAWYF